MSTKSVIATFMVVLLGAGAAWFFMSSREGNTVSLTGDSVEVVDAADILDKGPYADLKAAFIAEPQNSAVISKSYQTALDHYYKGEFATSSEMLTIMADRGHVSSMVLLAAHYRRGVGVELDLSKAASLFEGAIQKGNVTANFALGNLLYEGGEGLEKDQARAIELWQVAAAAGYKPAADKLATLR